MIEINLMHVKNLHRLFKSLNAVVGSYFVRSRAFRCLYIFCSLLHVQSIKIDG